jgi:hypothetical protein
MTAVSAKCSTGSAEWANSLGLLKGRPWRQQNRHVNGHACRFAALYCKTAAMHL